MVQVLLVPYQCYYYKMLKIIFVALFSRTVILIEDDNDVKHEIAVFITKPFPCPQKKDGRFGIKLDLN